MVNWKRISEYLLYGLGAGFGLFIIYIAFKSPPQSKGKPPKIKKGKKTGGHKKSVSFSEISSPRPHYQKSNHSVHHRHFSYSPHIKSSLYNPHQRSHDSLLSNESSVNHGPRIMISEGSNKPPLLAKDQVIIGLQSIILKLQGLIEELNEQSRIERRQFLNKDKQKYIELIEFYFDRKQQEIKRVIAGVVNSLISKQEDQIFHETRDYFTPIQIFDHSVVAHGNDAKVQDCLNQLKFIGHQKSALILPQSHSSKSKAEPAIKREEILKILSLCEIRSQSLLEHCSSKDLSRFSVLLMDEVFEKHSIEMIQVAECLNTSFKNDIEVQEKLAELDHNVAHIFNSQMYYS